MSVKCHHLKQNVVYNRPNYRESRFERATKVYTINQESQYLLVQNVHALGVTKELLELFSLYGDIDEYRILDDYPSEEYCEVYWIKFFRLGSARMAKRKLDNRSFYGKMLHLCYAPEYESVLETRLKLAQRRKIILQKTNGQLFAQGRSEGLNKSSQSTKIESENESFPATPHSANKQPLLNMLTPNVVMSQFKEGLAKPTGTGKVTIAPTPSLLDKHIGGFSVEKSNQIIPSQMPSVCEFSCTNLFSIHKKKRRRI